MGAKSIRFSGSGNPDNLRDNPGITVTDDRVKWEEFYDDEESALYWFFIKGLKFSLKWEKGEGYTITMSMGDAEQELRKGFERQHIDLAKSDAVDAAFWFFCEGAEEIDEAELNDRYKGDY